VATVQPRKEGSKGANVGGQVVLKSPRLRGICQFWADAMMIIWGIRHRNIFESLHDKNKQYVFIFNHISYMDIPIIMKAIRNI
jgi:1-acyl-sn-glycerol-3-phosphate acyltransferase